MPQARLRGFGPGPHFPPINMITLLFGLTVIAGICAIGRVDYSTPRHRVPPAGNRAPRGQWVRYAVRASAIPCQRTPRLP